MKCSKYLIGVPWAGFLFCAPTSAQVTSRASVATGGSEGNDASLAASISTDGRYVSFVSAAADLVAGDTNGVLDVFVRDRHGDTTEVVSVDSSGVQGNGDGGYSSITADGRYVAFECEADNLVAGDANGWFDVFVRDRLMGTTERVSVATGGSEGNGNSLFPSITPDGRYVAFMSYADNLIVGDTNNSPDIYVRDRQTGTTVRVSVDSGGAQSNQFSYNPSISADGRYVAFWSVASNLVSADTNGAADIFVRDRLNNTTVVASVDSAGVQGNGDSYDASISADGRYVAFDSFASNLAGGDSNASRDAFVHDLLAGTTSRLSIDSAGVEGNAGSWFPTLSADGRYAAFRSAASNLVGGDSNGVSDSFVRDRFAGTTERVSLSSSGTQGNAASEYAWISGNGRFVAFESFAANLVGGDSNSVKDVFVRDRDATGFTSLCSPGQSGVIACPCSNPPNGLGRGCNNSSGTGGAILSAAGMAYLSSDSLVFITSGEKPTALSIVGQWINANATGVVFGQGVRCTSGTLKRLFSKTASLGSITAPDFGAGDMSVSARSALKGDTILSGQSRWYVVYYRDNTVLGGCPAISNFNSTQTGQVTWSP